MPFPQEPMTIDQLKAHMDRRFDRLDRTKADRSELRRLAATADRRWAATRKAFKGFATKDDLKRFATKVDFARLEERVIAVQKSLQAIVRHHGLVLDDHEVRIGDLERRR
jgi:hypothetical protein